MKIAIWGNELMGWTAAAAFAGFGNLIHINQHLSQSESLAQQSATNTILFNEPGLLARVSAEYEQGNIIMGQPEDALTAPVHILALHPDHLEFAKQIITRIQKHCHQPLVVINYSTFGLGSTDTLAQLLDKKQQHAIAYIPDQLSEGSAYDNFIQAKSLVIGCDDVNASIMIKALYKPFSRHLDQLLIVKPREAEFMKFAVNGMLALRLGYVNELANLADQLDINIETIITGMGSDSRIGKHYLSPGCGFGGSHFSKSIQNMAQLLETKRNSVILNTLLEQNEQQKLMPFKKFWQHFQTQINDKTVAIWGLSFKPNTASIQNAASIEIVKTLLAQGCRIKAHDPQAMTNFKQVFPANDRLSYHDKAIDVLAEADALMILTEWNEYWSPDYLQMKALMRNPLIFDGRNIMDRDLLANLGFVYYGIGCSVPPTPAETECIPDE